MGIKNIWSLNIDEALVADKIKSKLNKKNYEVFFPTNAQLKDIDLAVLNLKNAKCTTIQVKGSRTYDPTKSEREKYGRGSATWFTLTKKSIFSPSNKTDFFIFVLHSTVDGLTKKEIRINYLVVPAANFKKLVSKKKTGKGDRYHFFIWIDAKGKRAFDFHNKERKILLLSKYLDNWALLQK